MRTEVLQKNSVVISMGIIPKPHCAIAKQHFPERLSLMDIGYKPEFVFVLYTFYKVVCMT